MASTLLISLCRRVADEIGERVLTATTSVAVGPDPGRWLISSELRLDGGEPRYADAFVYITGIGPARISHEVPSLGALATHVPITTHVQGTAFEVTWPLPLFSTQGVTGLVSLVQQAGWEVWTPDRIDLTTVAGQYSYSLSAQAAWLDGEDRVLGLYDPSLSGMAPEPADWRYGGLTLDGGSPTLRLTRAYLGSGGTAQLAVLRPASSLVSGAESDVGPGGLTDTVAADPSELVAVAKLRAYRYLAQATHISDEERARYAGLVGPQEAWVRASVTHYLPRDETQRTARTAATA